MNPVHFPEANETLAKSQPEYRVLPVCIQQLDPDVPYRKFTCKYELSDLEIEQIKITRSIWFSQTGIVFQPILPQVENAFRVCAIQYKVSPEGLYSFWVPMADGTTTGLTDIFIADAIMYLQQTTGFPAEMLYFIERPEMAIDGSGNIISL